MINIKTLSVILLIGAIAFGAPALSAAEKSYKASGELIKVNPTDFLLRTSAQDMEITHDAKTKVTGGELRAKANATVTYTKVAGRPYATEVQILKKDR